MITLPPSRLTLDIANLVTFTPYTIDVAAMTSKGHGPKGRVHLWTSEDSKLQSISNDKMNCFALVIFAPSQISHGIFD